MSEGDPVAWAVPNDRDWHPPLLFTDEERARRVAALCDRVVTPLYSSPRLTEEERSAISFILDDACGIQGWTRESLKGLLERAK